VEQNAPRLSARERRARHVENLDPFLRLPLTPGRVVSTAEACIRLNKSRTTLWRMRRDGELPNRPLTTDDLARLIAEGR
jgi:hypothetical protein